MYINPYQKEVFRLKQEREQLIYALRTLLPLAERVTFGSHDNYAPSESAIKASAILRKIEGAE